MFANQFNDFKQMVDAVNPLNGKTASLFQLPGIGSSYEAPGSPSPSYGVPGSPSSSYGVPLAGVIPLTPSYGVPGTGTGSGIPSYVSPTSSSDEERYLQL